MRNVKLTLAYDATDFHGWQIQPGETTVQGVLRDTLRQITQEDIVVHGAGRTDAGVHAWGQVANFKTESRLGPSDFLRACNALLPHTVRVREAEEAGPDFHARWSATAKTYRYRIHGGAVQSPFGRRYALYEPRPLDFAAMGEAAAQFLGRHDFASFAASSGCEDVDRERDTVKDILQSEVLRTPLACALAAGDTAEDEWVYVVRGRSFLRYMVRKMVGTLLEVGLGRLAPSDIPSILERRDRASSGPTAPPHGLCLMSVEYAEVSAESAGEHSANAASANAVVSR